MNKALYRVYRPQNFDEVYGQEPIVKIMKNSVGTGTFSHAYLFCGPRGTGKTSIARILAKAVNCRDNQKGNPDDKCDACKLINENRALDILEIDAASHTQVDNIRDVIIDRANFAPTNLKYKVYIIDEAHMLSKSSFNALLKTLEEPPEHTILILATTEINKIPSTIVSRCQRFDFKRIGSEDLVKRLKYISGKEKIEITEEALQMVAKVSEGGFRDAISLLDQLSQSKTKIDTADIEDLMGLGDIAILEDISFAFAKKDLAAALDLIEKYQDNGFDLAVLQKNLIEYLRKLLLASIAGAKETSLSAESAAKINGLLKEITTDEIMRIIGILVETDKTYKYSFLPGLSLEISAVKICRDEEPVVNTVIMPEIKNDKLAAEEKNEAKPAKKNTNGLWQQVLLEIKARNNTIHACLKVSEPEFDGKTVMLTFPYAFHKDRIEEPKNRAIVEEIIKRVYKEDYKIKCQFKPSRRVEEKAPKNDDLLKDALEIFGGEVIE